MSHDAYEKARKRVKKKKDFYSHLATYLAMGAFFLALNLLTAPGRWWFYWPMLGWGIGLAEKREDSNPLLHYSLGCGLADP